MKKLSIFKKKKSELVSTYICIIDLLESKH